MLADGHTQVAPGKIAAVVTSLEMLRRPPRLDVRTRPEWALRRVGQPDVRWYRGLFRRVGEDWLWQSRLRLSEAALAAIICHHDVEVYAVSSDGLDEGLVELDFRRPGTCELSFFGVGPRLVGQGAGRMMMNQAVEVAWSRPIRRFWVHTCTLDHPRALPFYIRAGFVPFARQIEIADDPRLDGLLPRTAAPQVPIIAGPAA